MSVGTSAAIALGITAAAGGVASSAIGAHASGSAAQQQKDANQQAIDEQRRQFDVAQGNSQPFIDAGHQSIAQLMKDFQSGKFDIGKAPEFQGGTFTAPTAAEAAATPGYQFTRDQATKVLQQQMNAQGQGQSGGEAQALARYTTGLADSTYNDVFSRSLSTYNAGLSKYQAELAGYGANLTGEAQAFNQELAPAQLGSGQASSINSVGQNSANSISQLMQGIGTAGAAGTIGSATAVNNGISNISSGITDSVLLSKLGRLGNQSKVPTGVTPQGGGSYSYDVG